MNILRIVLILALAVLLTPRSAESQIHQIYTPAPVYQTPIISTPIFPSTPGISQDPFAACSCNPTNPGECKCKNLDCKIKLPLNCKNSKPPTKTPILCKIYGKIPVHTIESNCLNKHCDFQYVTDVPEVHCIKETCCEIGTKLIQCLPGCCFNVCVPINACVTQTVQCKLSPKNMPMELWRRDQDGQVLYDVFVINNPDVNSPFHAGGMPAKWVIMHCGTAAQFHQRFPGAVCSDGKPMLNAKNLKQGVKPESTSADVDIKLVVDEKKVQQYIKELNEAKVGDEKKPETKRPESQTVAIDS